ncbi:DUF805 domain-containing protein [Rhizobium bangladeshense]|uniref:DUF805 domain-containing protein n=1 Tax=Rhizobium bangladeshense TaxID=1138189 RepID=A0ABS7LFG0_9HYPH|nr:DUF805 domain-containing protein [Rhizobium bangladeshense]MBX4868261.1 DUF805 domain-containing protein [Rhizobium bangladeshense]MBX4894519.1 DUF805 domain-containing protein [Rhizobium bangladeshense]MBX4920387.1 DUF805 domain-containing protein [Rhizobium bangladeshense]MBY3590206.1 DUF805 domain-containing protein [Rhizobium bangladeshense]MBY3612624.1 DUF805 domain-containing protein [Rhizobium bangladeshense]
MGFTEAVGTVFKKCVTFSGRASRSEYWWFSLFYALALFPLAILAFVLAFATSGGGAPSPIHYTVVIWMVFTLAILLPLISLQVRRFHDRNISGWWYLALFILSFVPYVVLVTFPVIIIISMLPGTEGPNKFGADPLRPEIRADVFA